MDTHTVRLSRRVLKDSKELPKVISDKLRYWVSVIEEFGLRESRKIKGFNDEALKGPRRGQRSVRLNRAYRAIYTEHNNGSIELNYIEVDEVNKHEY